MSSESNTPDEYIANLPADRQAIIQELRNTILKNIPKGFHEEMNYGMIGYVVPHSLYPKGYHCNPKLPLPFISLASQKNYIALHHMGMYDGELLDWFKNEWSKISTKKLDMGKCCIRFKKAEDVPMALIGQLVSKLSVEDWVNYYESTFKR